MITNQSSNFRVRREQEELKITINGSIILASTATEIQNIC